MVFAVLMAYEDVKLAAQGNWDSILVALAVPAEFLNRKHGPCPACGGDDRYRYTDYQNGGEWFCNGCGSGDGFELLTKVHEGWDRPKAVAEVGKHLNVQGGKSTRTPSTNPRLVLQRMMNSCVDDRQPMIDYLNGRGLTVIPSCLQFHPSLTYINDENKIVGDYPAMMSKVIGSDDSAQSIHRTYLGDVPTRRKMMPPIRNGGLKGAAIRLMPVDNGILGLAEGIETAIAVHELAAMKGSDLPVWACLNAGQLGQFDIPKKLEIHTVVICGDNDENFTGHAATYLLAKRMFLKGLKVQIRIPTRPGTDWLDVLNEVKGKEQ
jgi:putative DNA primase/helicase